MARSVDQPPTSPSLRILSNAEIADRLGSLGQILSANKENPYKVRAYHRAAARIRNFSASLDEMVRGDQDLTQFPGIGEAIASAIREIVLTGTLGKLEKLRRSVSPAVAELTGYPRLDPKRISRVYKKLGISSVEELRRSLSLPGINVIAVQCFENSAFARGTCQREVPECPLGVFEQIPQCPRVACPVRGPSDRIYREVSHGESMRD